MFQKLDSSKSGTILMSDMCKFFNASRHPDVVAGRRTAEEAWFGLFGYLQTSAEGNRKASISYAVSGHFFLSSPHIALRRCLRASYDPKPYWPVYYYNNSEEFTQFHYVRVSLCKSLLKRVCNVNSHVGFNYHHFSNL